MSSLEHKVQTLEGELRALEAKQAAKQREADPLAGKLQIYTVDTELDEIMTAYKLTFMNLARVLMDVYLGRRMERDTLIAAVLRLPGERAVTQTTETVRIYDQPRDPAAMAAVRRACEKLTELGLVRGEREEDRRLLRFEVVENPAQADPKGRGSP